MAAAAAPKAASTAPANPLEDALKKITGEGVLSKTAGTSPLSYEGGLAVRPPADTVNIIEGPEGTGMSKAEQLSAERAEAAEKLAAQKFAYEQQQNVLQDVYAKAAEQRAAEQFGLTKQTTAQQLATSALGMEAERQRMAQTKQGMGLAASEEARSAQQWGLEQEKTRQAMALAAAENQRKAEENAMKYGPLGSYENLMRAQRAAGAEMVATGGAPVGSAASTAYRMATYPGYQPSAGERLNAQATGTPVYSPYHPTYSKGTLGYAMPAASTGRGYYDMSLRRMVYT